MDVLEAEQHMRDEIKALLLSQKLPVEDLPLPLSDFYVAVETGMIRGLIGMERYGQYGLLRSLVVDPPYRNQQIAGTLVAILEQKAATSGIKALYLLTETAAIYFTKKGFESINREEVPDEVKMSSEFSHVCPVSAVVMRKQLYK